MKCNDKPKMLIFTPTHEEEEEIEKYKNKDAAIAELNGGCTNCFGDRNQKATVPAERT